MKTRDIIADLFFVSGGVLGIAAAVITGVYPLGIMGGVALGWGLGGFLLRYFDVH